jgi:hypothetical protein
MPKRPPPGPRLLQFANLWTLALYPSRKREWSLERKLEAVAGAGFDGVVGRAQPGIGRQVRAAGLRFCGMMDAPGVQAIRERLDALAEHEPEVINVQAGDHDTPTARALKLAVAVNREATRRGLRAFVEVHRDTCTETPEKALALARAYRQETGEDLLMTWDHSHPGIVKHLAAPDFADRLLVPKRLHQITPMYHFRPFNGHHCQIPVTNGKGSLSPEFKAWLPFVEAAFKLWLEGPKSEKFLYVCPELGPVPSGYALSAFPDVWEDCVRCMKEIAKIWRRLQRQR